MFEWLKGKELDYKGNDYIISGFNEKDGKFILSDEEGINDTIEVRLDDKDFNQRYLNYHFTYENDWAEKLYNTLLKNNELTFTFWSLESGDNWIFEIKRTETKVTGYLTIVNYSIVAGDDLRGKIFSMNKEEESLKSFTKWIDDQMENEPLLNSDECFYQVMEGITMEESFITESELKYLYDSLDV